MNVRSILAGSLALIVLEIVVTSRQATGRVSGIFGGVAKAVGWLLDPHTPGIPDRTKPSTLPPSGPFFNAYPQANPSSSPSSVLTPPATTLA